jgi:prevent-host-death family protein
VKTASVAEVKTKLSAYLKESESGPVVVTRNGKPIAVLLAVTDEDELERLVLAHSPKFRKILDKSRRDIEKTGGIPHDRFWQEVAAENQDKPSKTRSRPRST